MSDRYPVSTVDLERLNLNVEHLHDDYLTEAVKRDKRIRRTEIAIAASLIVAVLAITVAILAVAALNNYKRDNARARVASCEQFNTQQVRNRRAFRDNAEVLVAQAKNPKPDQVAAIKQYRAAQAAKALIDYPIRDCSPEGIRLFLRE